MTKQIVINISDNAYKKCKNLVEKGNANYFETKIANGTPLEEIQQPCEDAISRTSLLAKLDPCFCKKEGIVSDTLAEGFMQVKKLIKGEQPVTPARPHGHWIKQTLDVKPFGEETILCDLCAFMTDEDTTYKFCPNCGADMQEVENVKYN